ncbi:MAG TPA: alpha/beta-type small acid-soluble spore protein [Clostridia bacterium]|nr:alpha/beta-type small acid-soluble spore protein [Clostridia bacterium]
MAQQNNSIMVKGAKQAMENMKYEIASQVGVNLNKGYNGDILSKDAGRIGGQMVKKMISEVERQMAGR